jgi:beta-phosphoglucomutase-like phosphatase (HAD superfamily)
VDAIIFDFDGVLLESEYAGNRHIAELLSELGHPTDVEEALTHFSGLNGPDFIAAIEARIGGSCAKASPRSPERSSSFAPCRPTFPGRLLRRAR